MGDLKVTGLFVYPVKSCRGISLSSAQLEKTGLAWDRRWCVVKQATGRFVTQREHPKLALVDVDLPAEALVADWGNLPPDAALSVSTPGMPPLKVPLTPKAPAAVRTCTVWDYTGTAADEGDDAAKWFSTLLGFPCRMVRYLGADGGTVRTTEAEFAQGFETRFTDGYPMLLASEASLADLNSRLPSPLPMNRFRPNIVVDGGGKPWGEDLWRTLQVATSGGPIELLSVKPCSRCKVTTIDQATATVGDEPLDVLSTFRNGKVLGWAEKDRSNTHAVFFAWNCVSRCTGGRISVGDAVTVAHSGPELSAPVA